MSLPEISPGREKPKAQFLKETYDVSFDGGEARENLKKVPHGKSRRADAKAQEWLQEERQKAEERAEKRWRQKFEEWQASFQSETSETCKEPSSEMRSEAQQLVEPQLEGLRTRAEAAEKECEELRNECQGQLDELARLYEEFRRAHQKVQEEKARRETIEKHLGSAVEEQGKWTEKLAHRMSQLQQARQQRRAIGARIDRFGKELHTLDLRTGEWLTQAINERGREMPSMEEELSTARASAADAEHQAEEAQKSTQELQEFLSSPEVLAIDAIQQEVERMSFAEAYQDAFKPWALEQPEEAEEAEEPEIDAEESGFDGLDPSSSRDPRTETDMGTQSPQSPISPLSPQSAYEDLGEQSPDSASYQNGQIEEEASYNQEDFSPTGDPSSPQETELERSYALDDAFEEEPLSPASPGPEDAPQTEPGSLE